MNENLSGTTETMLRTNSDIKKVDAYGNVVETSNGKGISSCVLMGNNYRNAVAILSNAQYQDVLNSLDVSYDTLQLMDTTQLKAELLKLYADFPQAFITINLYNTDGRLVNSIDRRKNEMYYHYDAFGRLINTTDKDGNVITANQYKFGTN